MFRNPSDAVLVVFDREMHLDLHAPLAVGDTFDVVRGNGPREGDRMGTATVTSIEDGVPELSVLLNDPDRRATS